VFITENNNEFSIKYTDSFFSWSERAQRRP